MSNHTYLRYECADAFGLTMDTTVARCSNNNHNNNPNLVVTNAGALLLGWNVHTMELEFKVGTILTNQTGVGTGQALTNEIMTTMTVQAQAKLQSQQELPHENSNTPWIATGWNTGTVRVYETPTKSSTSTSRATATATTTTTATTAHSLLTNSKHNQNHNHNHSNDDSFYPEPRLVLQGHSTAVSCLCFGSNDHHHNNNNYNNNHDHLLASGSVKGVIVLWDMIAETGLFRLLGHSDKITSLQFHSTSSTTTTSSAMTTLPLLFSTCLDGLVKVWNLEQQCCTQTLANHNGQVWNSVMFRMNAMLNNNNNNNKELDNEAAPRVRYLTGSVDGQVRVWNVSCTNPATTNTTTDDEKTDNKTTTTTLNDTVLYSMGSLSSIPTNIAGTTASAIAQDYNHNSKERIVAMETYGSFLGVLHYASKVVILYTIRSSRDAVRKQQRRLKRRREKQQQQTKLLQQQADHDATTKDAKKKTKKRGILDDDDDDDQEAADDKDDPNTTTTGPTTEEQEELLQQLQAGDEFEYYGTIRASHKIRHFCFLSAKLKSTSATASSSSSSKSKSMPRIVCGLATNALEVHVLPSKSAAAMAAAADKSSPATITQTPTILDMYGHATGIRSIALSSDDVLACTVSKNILKVWNTARRSCLQSQSIQSDSTVSSSSSKAAATDATTSTQRQYYGLCVAFLPGNTHVICGTREGHLLIFDVPSGRMVYMEETAHDGAIWSLDVKRPTNQDMSSTTNTNMAAISIMTGSADKTVKFWDLEVQDHDDDDDDDHVMQDTYHQHPMVAHTRTLQMTDDVVAVKYSHSITKRLVFVSTLDSTIKVFFEDSLKFFLSLYGHALPALAVDASDDDVLLASAGADKTIKLWGLDFGDTHRTMYGHADSITDLRFCPRTHMFFTCSKDKTIRYWDGDRFEQILILDGHMSEVNALAISRTGAFLLSGGMDRQVRVWERTKDMVFVEEERERELEQNFDRIVDQNENEGTTTTFGILNKKQLEDADHDDDDDAEDENQPQSAAAVRKSVLSVAAGDRIMEALERADQELKDMAVHNRRQRESAAIDKSTRTPNILLMGLEPSQYVLWILKSVKSAELEQSLMILSMRHVERLIYYLITLLKAGRGIELCCRIAIFMITTHQKQIIATHTVLVVPLRELRRLVRLRLHESRDAIGFNIAALRSIAKVAKERKESYFNPDTDAAAATNVWAGMGLGSDVAAALESGRKTKV